MFVDRGMTYTRYDLDRPRTYKVTINAYHVTVSREAKQVFSRTGGDGWLDQDHKLLIDAIDQLEAALKVITSKYDT